MSGEDANEEFQGPKVAPKRPPTYVLTPARPNGVLAVHLKELRVFNGEFLKLFDHYIVSMYVRIILGNCVKCSCVHTCKSIPSTIYLDDLKHFRVQIDPVRSHNESTMRLELVGFDRPDVHRIISRKVLSIHDLVKSLYVVDTCRFLRTERGVADLEAEFCFAYGSFGYGYSHQIENPLSSPIDQIAHSMFCRLPPPPGRDLDNFDVMACRPVGHPPFINFTEKAHLVDMGMEFGSDTELKRSKMTKEPKILVSKMRKRLRSLHTDYEKETSRKGRLLYLRHLMWNDHLAGGGDTEEISTGKHVRLKRRAAMLGKEPEMAEQKQMTSPYSKEEDDVDVSVSDAAEMLMAAPGVGDSRNRQRNRSVKVEPEAGPSAPMNGGLGATMNGGVGATLGATGHANNAHSKLMQRRGTRIVDATEDRFIKLGALATQTTGEKPPEQQPHKWSLLKWITDKSSVLKAFGGATVAPAPDEHELEELNEAEEGEGEGDKEEEGKKDTESLSGTVADKDTSSTGSTKPVKKEVEQGTGSVSTLATIIESVSNMLPGRRTSVDVGEQRRTSEPKPPDHGRRRSSSIVDDARRFIQQQVRRVSQETPATLDYPRVMLTPPSPCPSSSSSDDEEN